MNSTCTSQAYSQFTIIRYCNCEYQRFNLTLYAHFLFKFIHIIQYLLRLCNIHQAALQVEVGFSPICNQISHFPAENPVFLIIILCQPQIRPFQQESFPAVYPLTLLLPILVPYSRISAAPSPLYMYFLYMISRTTYKKSPRTDVCGVITMGLANELIHPGLLQQKSLRQQAQPSCGEPGG